VGFPSAKTTGLEGKEEAMVQYVITPWRHQSELIEVREKLYGNGKDVAAMRDAVDLVGVWSKSALPYFSSGSLVSFWNSFSGVDENEEQALLALRSDYRIIASFAPSEYGR
jgi:hypothetical protein